MTQYLRQSTAATLKLGPFIDDTGAATTALTISQADVRLSKNGGNMAQKNEATACTHDEIGFYDCPIDTTDTNTLGRLDVMVAETGSMIVVQSFTVIPATIYDQMLTASFPRGPVLASGTLGATGNSTTALHLSGLAYADDDINGNAIVIFDVSTGLAHSTYITDWANTGDLATVPTLPFTPEASVDTYIVLAAKKDPDVATILADTNDIQTRLPAALVSGRIDASVGAMAANVMTAAAAAADLTTELQSGLATAASITSLDGKIDTIDNFLDTEVAAILADTNELQTDWANGGRLDLILDARASQTSVDTIDDLLDTEVAAIQSDITTLLGRLTAARAGYLDFLNGTVAGRLKKNTAFTNFMIKMELTDGSPGTGLTVTVQRAIDGGAFAALAVTTVTEISAGWYKFDLAAADVNGDAIAVKATATGAKQLDLLILTQVAG